jgi:uncharacterized protein YigA (DUF484 family)
MTLPAKDVAQYLKDHPEFFNEYAELLAQISIPDPHGGRAISITERQMGSMREQIRSLESKLADMLRYGEENDILSAKLQRMAVSLVGTTDMSGMLLVVYAHLGSNFAIPHVAVRLWDVPGNQESLEFVPLSPAAREFVADMKRPYCGAGSGPDVVDWFGEDGSHVRSVALVPLRRGIETFGLLALGSEEPERFYPDMGTVYLERIGELVSAALVRSTS